MPPASREKGDNRMDFLSNLEQEVQANGLPGFRFNETLRYQNLPDGRLPDGRLPAGNPPPAASAPAAPTAEPSPIADGSNALGVQSPRSTMPDAKASLAHPTTVVKKKNVDDMANDLLRKLKGTTAPWSAAANKGNKKPKVAAPKKSAATKKTPKAWPIVKKLAFPGVPTKPAPVVIANGYKIYTSVASSQWRVLKIGERVDKGFHWTTNPKEAWSRVLKATKIQ